MEETISLNELFSMLKRRLILILSCILGAIIFAVILSYFVLTPKYESSSQFIVNQKQQGNVQFDITDIQTNVELINTYNVIIKSKVILDDVVKELKLPYDADQLERNIQLSSEQDSQVVTVKVTDTDHARATNIANTTVEIFQKKTPEFMNGIDNITILTQAEEQKNPKQTAPRATLNIAIALGLGLLIGIGLAFLLEYLDTSIATERDVEEQLELPVLGVITTITAQDIVIEPYKSRLKKRKGILHVSR